MGVVIPIERILEKYGKDVKKTSVLIKGMEMPTSCSNCELCACYTESAGEVYRCDITMYPIKYFEKREDHCPLIPIPPHGRLIDADALTKIPAEEDE